MNKAKLIHVIQKELGAGATKQHASDALHATLKAITSVVSQEKVQIVGFGTFEKKKRPARIGRNPLTGRPMDIPESEHVAFKASPVLKKKIQ